MHVLAKLLGRFHPRNATSIPSVRLSSSFLSNYMSYHHKSRTSKMRRLSQSRYCGLNGAGRCLHCSVIYFFIGPGRNGSMSASSQQIPDQDHGIARSRSASTTPSLNPCSISVSVNYFSFSPPRPRWRVNSSMSGCHSYLLIPSPHKSTLFSL